MKEILAQWQQQLDKLNQRERLLVMLSVIAVVGFVLFQIMVEPFQADRQRLVLQAGDLQSKMAESLAQQQTLQALVSGVLQSPIMQRREQLKKSIAASEQQLNESVSVLISPATMAQVLEGVLSKNKNLQLLRLENLPVQPLFQTEAATAETASVDTKAKPETDSALFQHAFIIELRGDYPALREYLQELKKLPWQFYWDELNYQVEVYPQATIRIRVHTVSLAEEWIRV